MKLLVLDGNSIINRAFYGIKLLSTKDGQFTNGIYGFLTILNRLVEREHPDGIAVAFDVKKPTFRHEKYADYKAGRKGMPPELATQIPVLKELLPLMGYCCIEKDGYEADDILGTLSTAAEQSGDECVISTGDRDSLQLISDKVKVLLATTKMGKPEIIEYNKEALFEKYGLSPAEMVELKALMGDASDHIPGVPGVGEKTATDLIQRFHSIDAIYESIESAQIKDSVRAKLTTGKESAYLSRELGTIHRQVPINTNLVDYTTCKRNDAELGILLKKLEFFSLLEKMNLSVAVSSELDETMTEYAVSPDITQCALLAKEEKEAFLVLNLAENKAGVVVGTTVWELELEGAGLIEFSAIITDGSTQKTVHDSKEFYKFCAKNNIVPAGIGFDTMLAGYLVSPSASSYDLARLSGEYVPSMPAFPEEMSETAKFAVLCALVSIPLNKEILINGQESLLHEMEMPLAKVLAEMELCGFLVDTDGIIRMGEGLAKRIYSMEQEVYDMVGYTFNLNSPKQLGEALFEKLGLPAKKKTKSGYSTNAEVLEGLRDQHPAIEILLQYRTLTKLKSTYCDGLVKTVSSDGRIHTTFNQTEARTGRISSTEPNLQNIPVRSDEGRELRRFFKAKEGYLLLDADYSQIELRVLAHVANDKAMINAFNTGVDIHTLTASEVFNMPIILVTPKMRSSAKAVNFGIVYGIGAFSLSKDIGVTRKEADQYIKGYFDTYPQVKKYMDTVIDRAKADGFVTTLFGRRRYLPELSSSNGILRAFGERVARNMPIQGTAADIIKLAMIKVAERLKAENLDAQLILQVHDELIVESSEQDVERAAVVLKEEMEHACKMTVEMLADVHSGKTWYDAKQ